MSPPDWSMLYVFLHLRREVHPLSDEVRSAWHRQGIWDRMSPRCVYVYLLLFHRGVVRVFEHVSRQIVFRFRADDGRVRGVWY